MKLLERVVDHLFATLVVVAILVLVALLIIMSLVSYVLQLRHVFVDVAFAIVAYWVWWEWTGIRQRTEDARERNERLGELCESIGRALGLSGKDLARVRVQHAWPKAWPLAGIKVTYPHHVEAGLDPDTKIRTAERLQRTVTGTMGHVSVRWEAGAVTLERATKPVPVPTRVEYRNLSQDTENHQYLPFGIAANNEQVGWDTNEAAHCLVFGETGTGKTMTVMSLAGAALDKGWQVLVVDPKADDFTDWRDSGICPVATDLCDMIDMVAKVRAEKIRRYQIAKAQRAELPPWLLVVDEMASLLSAVGYRYGGKMHPVMEDLLDVARQGRAAGIHLLIGTQRPDVNDIGGGSFRDQLGLRIALGQLTQGARSMVEAKGSITAHPKGRALVIRHGHEQECQVALPEARTGLQGGHNPGYDPISQPSPHVGTDDAVPSPMPTVLPRGAQLAAQGLPSANAQPRAEARKLADQGVTVSEIARQLGLSRRTVGRYLEEDTPVSESLPKLHVVTFPNRKR